MAKVAVAGSLAVLYPPAMDWKVPAGTTPVMGVSVFRAMQDTVATVSFTRVQNTHWLSQSLTVIRGTPPCWTVVWVGIWAGALKVRVNSRRSPGTKTAAPLLEVIVRTTLMTSGEPVGLGEAVEVVDAVEVEVEVAVTVSDSEVLAVSETVGDALGVSEPVEVPVDVEVPVAVDVAVTVSDSEMLAVFETVGVTLADSDTLAL